jgi:hypothetical protein
MESLELFYLIKSVHGPLAGVSFLMVTISDFYGLLWVWGKLSMLNLRVLVWLHRIVFVGLGGLILTGLTMVFLNSADYLTNLQFWAKMFFVAVLFWNSFRIGKELNIPSQKTFQELTVLEKRNMLIIGGTSIVAWISVFILVGAL